MKCIISVEQLGQSISKVLSIVEREKKNIRPIFSYIKVEVKEGSLEIQASDGEISAKVLTGCKTNEPGSICLNAKNIYEIVRELPQDTNVELQSSNNQNTLELLCEKIRYTLLTSPDDSFPQLKFSNNESKLFTIPCGKVLEIINKTIHSISHDETRPQLNGVYLERIEGQLRAVSTDAHRLSLVDLDLHDSMPNFPAGKGIIIPKKGIFELKKMAESFNQARMFFGVTDTILYVHCEEKFFLSIALVARDYPPYQTVIPKTTHYLAKIDKGLALNAIKRIKIMANEKTHGIRLRIRPDEIIISANHPSFGEAIEKIPAQYEGKEMEIGFNARYLIDAIANLDDGIINMEINNEIGPVVFRIENHADFGVIMPLKL